MFLAAGLGVAFVRVCVLKLGAIELLLELLGLPVDEDNRVRFAVEYHDAASEEARCDEDNPKIPSPTCSLRDEASYDRT